MQETITIPVIFVKLAVIPLLIAVMLSSYWQVLKLWDKLDERRILRRAAKQERMNRPE